MDTVELLPSLAQGELAETSAPELVAAVYRARASGTLVLEAEDKSEVRLFFRAGQPCGVANLYGGRALAYVLLSNDFVSAMEIESSYKEAAKRKCLHGQVLLERGLLSQEDLRRALALQHHLNLGLVLARIAGRYDWRGWEPPPGWADVQVDPIGQIVEALATDQRAPRRAALIGWLQGAYLKAAMDWPELLRRLEASEGDRRCAALLATPFSLDAFAAESGMPRARSEAFVAALLLVGGLEPAPAPAARPAPVSRPPAPPVPAVVARPAPAPSVSAVVARPAPRPAPAAVARPATAPRPPPAALAPPPETPPAARAALAPPRPAARRTGEVVPVELAGESSRPTPVVPQSRAAAPSPERAPAPRPYRGEPRVPGPEAAGFYRGEPRLPAELPPASAQLPRAPALPHEAPAGRTQLAPRPALPAKPRPAPAPAPETELPLVEAEPLQLADPLPAPGGLEFAEEDLSGAGHAASAVPEALEFLDDEPLGAGLPLELADAPHGGADEPLALARHDELPEAELEEGELLQDAPETALPVPTDAFELEVGPPAAPHGLAPAAAESELPMPDLFDGIELDAAPAEPPPGLYGAGGAPRLVPEKPLPARQRPASAPASAARPPTAKKSAVDRMTQAIEAATQGEALLQRRDFAGAKAALKKAVELGAGADTQAALAWAVFSETSGSQDARKVEADKLIARALAAEPSARTHYVAGLLSRTGAPAEAAEHFRKALELDPGHADARLELRMLEMRMPKGALRGLFGKQK